MATVILPDQHCLRWFLFILVKVLPAFQVCIRECRENMSMLSVIPGRRRSRQPFNPA